MVYVVSHEVSKRLLAAIVSSYPASGVILGIKIHQGWGDIMSVEIAYASDRWTGESLTYARVDLLRVSIIEALEPRMRHSVRTIQVDQ